MQIQCFIRRGAEQWGPLEQRAFNELKERGGVLEDDLVWCTGWPDWKQFSDTQREARRLPPPIPATSSQTDSLERLVNDHLNALGIEPNKRSLYQYVELLNDFLDSSGPASQRRTENEENEAILLADALIEDLLWACRRIDFMQEAELDPPERYRVIWRHRNLARAFKEGFTSAEACPIDREALAAMPARYLKQHLRSAKFEALLVDALVAQEVYAYGEELKEHPSRFNGGFSNIILAMDEGHTYSKAKGNLDQLFWARLKTGLKFVLVRSALLYGVPIGVAWLAIENNWDAITVGALGFLAITVSYRLLKWVWNRLRAAFGAAPRSPYEKALGLYQMMATTYEQIDGGVSASPRRIREVLAKAADEGAAWNPGVFAVLDEAIARSPGSWR